MITWVVTREINEYNQDGEYFVGVFCDKPNFRRLKKLLPMESDVTIGKLIRGGGRHSLENEWYNLRQVESL